MLQLRGRGSGELAAVLQPDHSPAPTWVSGTDTLLRRLRGADRLVVRRRLLLALEQAGRARAVWSDTQLTSAAPGASAAGRRGSSPSSARHRGRSPVRDGCRSRSRRQRRKYGCNGNEQDRSGDALAHHSKPTLPFRAATRRWPGEGRATSRPTRLLRVRAGAAVVVAVRAVGAGGVRPDGSGEGRAL